MILYDSDFHTHRACVHTTTKNMSFVHMYLLLKRKGIRNNRFHLALTQPELMNVDPHDVDNLTQEQMLRIAFECKINPWYYFREVVRIPQQGSDPSPFQLHRGNMALIWAFYNNIDSFLVLPRQNGKTMSTQAIMSNLMYFRCKNYTIAMLTKDATLVGDNVLRLKEIRDALPIYLLNRKPTLDTENKEGISYDELKTRYITFIAKNDELGADKLGRGMTTPCQHWDEIAYFKNNHISYSTAIAATDAATESAKKVGMPHANILTTTAGKLDSPEGSYAYSICSKAMRFTERLYDLPNREALLETLGKNSTNNMLYIEFSYLQLGKTREWLAEKIARGNADKLKIARDYLNQWTSGTDNQLVPVEMLNKIRDSELEPLYTSLDDDGYIIRWYVAPEILKDPSFRKRPLVMGLDTSENIGRDFTTAVLVDPQDMSVLATFRCNESNIMRFSMFLLNLLLTYEGLVLIPERKSSAASILDILILELKKKKINPYRRIFNMVIQHRNEKPYSEINLGSDDVTDSLVRRYFGYTTTGGDGMSSRNMLYKVVLMKALDMNHSRIHDQSLIKEICELSVRNGRLDHSAQGHDDMVIAYLLACYLIYFGQNLHFYGLTEDVLLNRVSSTGEVIDPQEKQAQRQLRARIYEIEQIMKRTASDLIRISYQRELLHLQTLLDDTDIEPERVAKEQLVQEENKIRYAPVDVQRLTRMFGGGF